MRKTTLEDVYETLLNIKNEIIIEEDIRQRALNCLLNMHRYTGDENEAYI